MILGLQHIKALTKLHDLLLYVIPHLAKPPRDQRIRSPHVTWRHDCRLHHYLFGTDRRSSTGMSKRLRSEREPCVPPAPDASLAPGKGALFRAFAGGRCVLPADGHRRPQNPSGPAGRRPGATASRTSGRPGTRFRSTRSH